ncbi:MAG: 4-alpha-glucanotransferase [Elusimicrobia bacterium]|nr:4-alpha-glucanotransferase [Elusimicrobiota bacterium]
MIKRLGAAILSALIVVLSFGPEAMRAVAGDFSTKAAPSVRPIVLPEIPRITTLGELSTPPVLPRPLAELGVVPDAGLLQIQPSAEVSKPVPLAQPPRTGFEAELERLEAPSLVGALHEGAPAEAFRGAGAGDFSEHILGERSAPAAGDLVETSVPIHPTQTSLPPSSGRGSGKGGRVERPRVEARSALFPAVIGGAFGAAALAFKAAADFFVPAVALGAGASAWTSVPHVVLLAAAAVLAVPAAVFLPRAAWESAQFGWAVWRGRKVTDDDFRRFVEAEVLAKRLDGGVARLIRIYRPKTFSWDLGLGYHSNGEIALRPELAATPTLFRSVLAHEFRHFREPSARGPPAGFVGGLWRHSVSEVSARVIELNGTKALKDAKVPGLERALREAQLSLNLDQPYEMLVLNAGSAELKNEELYKNLSSGRAKVESLTTSAPHLVLGDAKNARRYKAVVMDKPDSLLPASGTTQAKKLDLALQQLDSLYLLATRRMTEREGVFKPGSSEVQRYRELAAIAKTMAQGNKKEVKKLERLVKDFWHQIASTRLKGVGPADFIEKLYDGLQNKGLAFLSFGPTDPGVLVWEKLLRYWEAADGGEFRTVRVDLEDGGHIMILRKVEARVGLWLRPANGSEIEKSVPDASGSPESQAVARVAMAQAGFKDQLASFAKLQEAADRALDAGNQTRQVEELRAAVAAASAAGKLSDLKAFNEKWINAGIVAERQRGPQGVKEFDELSKVYLKAFDAKDPAALRSALGRLDAFAARLVGLLGRPLEAPPQEFDALIAAGRREVEATNSANSLTLFDDAAARLRAASGRDGVTAALKAYADELAALRTSLERAGFKNYMQFLDDLDLEVRDVFGKDVGRQEIYVTIPRRNAAAIRKFVSGSSVQVGSSQTHFKPDLMDSAAIQNVPAVWKLGITGEGGLIEWIDTGADAAHEDFEGRLDRVDMVHEGPEDWIGHGSHTAGISISGSSLFTGMAKGARGLMAKVFSRESPGAADGDIMGAGTLGLHRGVDVISLSLGSRGNSSDNLARFFSQLTLQKNSKGEYIIVVASAGNAGPFDETISQPSAGENVISVAAAAKSEDDKVPEIAFFSSVGPDRPGDSAVDWAEIKPDLAAIGGDVVTDPGDPNVYKRGVYSVKSKDMPAGPSDLPDKKHTGMSGTSMAAPMIAAIALLVKQALKMARAIRDFVYENLPLSVKAVLMRTATDMQVPVWFQGAGLVNAGAAVKLVLSAVSGSLLFRLSKVPGLAGLAPEAGADSWAWIARYKSVIEAGKTIRKTAEIAKSDAQARFEDQPASEDEDAQAVDKPAVGDKVYAEMVRKFNAARDAALPALLEALKDPVWLVRRQAALVLLNCRAASSVQALLDAALHDEDARVRQMALLALAENPSRAADAELKTAAADPRWDVAIYSAYALARHGDASEVGRILAQTRFEDEQNNSKGKQSRYSAVWLLGQLRNKTTAVEAQALSAKVNDLRERGNIRHLAAAALYNVAQNQPGAITDQVFVDLLAAAGPQNLALTRTISKFFPTALQDRRLLGLLRQEPVKSAATAFVLKNRVAAQRPGALGELVSLLGKALSIPLDVPTPLPDPGGLGVPGVDPALGPLDVIVEAPNASAGLDAALLARFSASQQDALPLSKALWVRVPEHKLFAFSLEMRRLGFTARLSRPYYSTAAPVSRGPIAGGLSLDLAAGPSAIPAGADLSLVRLSAERGVSEAMVMAVLEEIASRVAEPLKSPTVVAIALAGPALKKDDKPVRGPLGELINRLVLNNYEMVLPTGNGGPSEDSISSPADAGLGATVAAAGEKTGLQFYSGRGTDENPGVTWTDLVADADLEGMAKAAAEAMSLGSKAAPAYGTGVAAARSAEKIAGLAKRLAADFIAQSGVLPDGFFLYIESLVKQTLSAMPAHKISEVGGGLFGDEAKALALLEERLKDPQGVARESAALIEQARGRFDPSLGKSQNGLGFWNRMKDPYARAARAVVPKGLHSVAAMAAGSARALAPGHGSPSSGRGPPAGWWKDSSATHEAVSVPIFSLRRGGDDPGVGKFSDLPGFFKDNLSKHGADTVLLLPHFAILDESPYAPVSLYALSEDSLDWSLVNEVDAALRAKLKPADPRSVDYRAVREREGAVAQSAYRNFQSRELARATPRAAEFEAFRAENDSWLGEYAEFMALSSLIGRPSLDWTPADVEGARKDARFGAMTEVRKYSQWLAYGQLQAALAEVHASGGHVLFDIPMFRAKNSVDAWKRPELFTDLRIRNPGIKNQWVHEDWLDLALWNWTQLKADGYKPMLDLYRHWLAFGFDGGRVDALHFAYNFGNGQLASGDEPGEPYVEALAKVFSERGALPVAEAFEGKDADAIKHGFMTIYGDWKKVGSPDDPRQLGFMARYLEKSREATSGRSARFIGYTLGDELGDPTPIKVVNDGRSYWRYRTPRPEDGDYLARVREDARPQLTALKAAKEGNVWREEQAVKSVLAKAGDSFVKHAGGSTQIWAASVDWFLEEWGRDTFVSLPGLLLSTGRFDEAKEVMRRFSRFEHEGLIPNKIWDASRWSPQNPDGADYNTVDAPLWFIAAVKKYAETTGDWAFAAEMSPVMGRIVARYRSGTGYQRFNRLNRIAMDSDGLIMSPAQATWMDADPDGRDKPVTPRNGKAVEINALWYSSLRFLAESQRRNKGSGKELDALADKVKKSFNERFWFETGDNAKAWGGKGGALKDVVDGDPHSAAIRPNMLFAVSHGGDLLSPGRQRALVLAATRDLLTPYGLRTLSFRDSYYQARYDTSRPAIEKDQAYHQGAVWPWLIGPYLDALRIVRRGQGWKEERIREEALGLLKPLAEHLVANPLGSLPEVFDGGAPDPAVLRASLDDPKGLGRLFAGRTSDQKPGGTRSQAWSVAEVLRVLANRR